MNSNLFNSVHSIQNLKYNMAEQKNQLNIELSEEMAEGAFANLAMIAHTNEEFVIDFIRVMPNMPKAKVKARVILTPQHAKRVMRALIENVQRYEAQHGTIAENQPNNPPFPIHFNTPKAEA
jgi:3-deoxy-D-manno-octulosonic-acid transferase